MINEILHNVSIRFSCNYNVFLTLFCVVIFVFTNRVIAMEQIKLNSVKFLLLTFDDDVCSNHGCIVYLVCCQYDVMLFT